MTPWRKRLGDLRQLIMQAERVYFEPDLFRLNVNNAIQTSRTVTFLIQKNKRDIRDFDHWYAANVLEPFSADGIMNWLKEARNHIEKEGDLEVNSECSMEAIFSYTDPGPRVSLKHDKMFFAGIKRLSRHMRDVFPTGIYRDSAIAIDRRWVATALPGIELIDALKHGYEKLRFVVDALDAHVGRSASDQLLWNPPTLESGRRRTYVKTEDGKSYSQTSSAFEIDYESMPKLAEKYDLSKFRSAFQATGDPHETMKRFTETATHVFSQAGTHVTIGFLLDTQGDVIRIASPNFADHADKLIFWNDLGRLAESNRDFCGIIFVSEIWFRSGTGFPEKRISDLQIKGEGLQIVVANRDVCLMKTIPVIRDDKGARLDDGAVEVTQLEPNFLAPLRRAWRART